MRVLYAPRVRRARDPQGGAVLRMLRAYMNRDTLGSDRKSVV